MIMLKFENTAQVGEIIKAYDFAGIKTEFLTGKVIAKGDIMHPVYNTMLYRGYTVEILAQGENGGYEIGEIAYVPFETSFDYDGRVENVLTREELEMLLIAEGELEVH